MLYNMPSRASQLVNEGDEMDIAHGGFLSDKPNNIQRSVIK